MTLYPLTYGSHGKPSPARHVAPQQALSDRHAVPVCSHVAPHQAPGDRHVVRRPLLRGIRQSDRVGQRWQSVGNVMLWAQCRPATPACSLLQTAKLACPAPPQSHAELEGRPLPLGLVSFSHLHTRSQASGRSLELRRPAAAADNGLCRPRFPASACWPAHCRRPGRRPHTERRPAAPCDGACRSLAAPCVLPRRQRHRAKGGLASSRDELAGRVGRHRGGACLLRQLRLKGDGFPGGGLGGLPRAAAALRRALHQRRRHPPRVGRRRLTWLRVRRHPAARAAGAAVLRGVRGLHVRARRPAPRAAHRYEGVVRERRARRRAGLPGDSTAAAR